MQSEEVATPPDPPPSGGDENMTFTDSKDSPPITHDDSKFFPPTPTNKFENVNLEDDIEKVEVSSNESSEPETPPIQPFPDQNPNESIKSWLQRITELHKKLNLEQTNPYNSELRTQPLQPATPSRVVKYQDLPYMGEMTLDNSKPRRGRKPKKADICHLIYKNYGTIFPGTPNPKSYLTDNAKKTISDQTDGGSKSDVRNKMLSSLLEKRLTQDVNKKTRSTPTTLKGDQNEPLNLCIRDLNHLKIRLLKKNDNTYTSEIKSEPASDDDVELIESNMKISDGLENIVENLPSSPELPKTPEAPGGYVYWPNAGVFIHPMALQQHLMYYQNMVANNNYTLPTGSPKSPPESVTNNLSASGELKKLVPKNRRKTDDELLPTHQHQLQQELKVKRNASGSSADKTPTKRKRSAIFIPPIPTENNTNPATEVSICKFKFTGGAKPSLQEKKMLSVDSGGNFRYYSGTGDKSMRGYEFFPRETLQQQINSTQGSSTGAFLQASGEKIYPSIGNNNNNNASSSVDFTGNKANADFLMTTPEIPAAPPQVDLNAQQLRHSNSNKKRKSRKSLQREKLEQTFKEKGFLIQTQQLESAEGATYCKFRQLRKFTRYLFRSWKDYLPGNVRELQEGEKVDEDLNVEVDNSSRHSSEHSGNVPPL